MLVERLNIQTNKIKQLKSKGLDTLEDILWFFPRKYNDFRFETGILPKEEKSCLLVTVFKIDTSYKNPSYIKATCRINATGKKLVVVWFNQMYRLEEIKAARNRTVFVAGNVEYSTFNGCYQITTPDIFSPWVDQKKGIYPVYSKIRGMSDEYFSEVMKSSFVIMEDYINKEVLPEDELEKNNIISRKEAFHKIHYPKTMEDIDRAKERFDFEDLLYFCSRTEWNNRSISLGSQYQIKSLSMVRDIEESLPFVLTSDQKTALDQMIEYSKMGKRLNALVQGDVGSGKSIVAFLLMAGFSSSGYQTVLMAPTQILARQHYEDLINLVGDRLSVVYLGAELKASEKRAVKAKISSGTADIIVGTHAVIADDVEYKDLSLCVIDEEHKFGVAQRQKLIEKASRGVHTVKLSATPIPRSLTEVVLGKNVQLFNIKTMPDGRIPVKTGIAVSRQRIYDFIISQVKKKGHQIYVVCPMIDENEKVEGVKSVKEISEEYISALSPYGIIVGTVTGKDSKTKSEETINAFKGGQIDVLISTTVIEVGVNVPNATGIIIHSAERFGLSQLHQLRGRVGRSSFKSYCVFETENLTDKAKARLNTLCSTNSGFEVAEADLKLRGGGDLLGTAQSGDDYYIDLLLAKPGLYEKAKETAKRLLDAPRQCEFLKERVFADKCAL